MSALDSRPPIVRCEREQPGELIHIDIKKRGRIGCICHCVTGDRTGQCKRRTAGCGPGWNYLHVAIDDRSCLAFTQLLPSDASKTPPPSWCGLAWFRQHVVSIQCLMTDNGSAYKSKLFIAPRGTVMA